MGLGDLRHDVGSPYDPLMSHCYKCSSNETCRCDSIGYNHLVTRNLHYNNINGPQHQRNSGSLSPSSVVDSHSDDSDNSSIGIPCGRCQDLLQFNFSLHNSVPCNLMQLDQGLDNPIEEIFYQGKNQCIDNTDFDMNTMKNFCTSCKNHDNLHGIVETMDNCESIVATDETVILLPNDKMEITVNQDNVSNSDCNEITDEDEDIEYEYSDFDTSDDSLSSDDEDVLTDDDDEDDKEQCEDSDNDDNENLYPCYARLWSSSSDKVTNSDEDVPCWSDVSDDDDDDIDGQSSETIINQQEQQEIWESFANSSFPNCLATCSKIVNNDIITTKNVEGSHKDYNNRKLVSSGKVIGLDSKCKLQYQEKMKLRERDYHRTVDDDSSDDNSYSRPTRVHFKPGNQLVKVHLMVTWSYAYRAARKSTWSQHRCDQVRFLNRIKKVEETLQYILQPHHREKMYNYIMELSDKGQ